MLCVFSLPSEAICFGVDVFGRISLQLEKRLGGVFEVEPGSLGAHVDAAVGIWSPALLVAVPEVVGVLVVRVLVGVEARAVEVDLGLEGLRDVPTHEPPDATHSDEEGDRKALVYILLIIVNNCECFYKKDKQRISSISLGD